MPLRGVGAIGAAFGIAVVGFCALAAVEESRDKVDAIWYFLTASAGAGAVLTGLSAAARPSHGLVLLCVALCVLGFLGLSFAIVGGTG